MLLIRFVRIALICFALVSFPSFADDHLPIVGPEEVGFDADKLDHIEAFFEQKVSDGELAGIVTLVARHGKIAHYSAVGYQDVQRGIDMELDTIFRIHTW